jgi:ribonuclease-3
MNDLQELIKTLGLKKFNNLKILEESLTHRSFSRTHNERYEFLGDAVLELVITENLYRDYPNAQEGELTSYRSAIVKTDSLCAEATRLDLGNYILMSKGEESTGGRNRPYILADVFESIIGAIYLDQGYEECRRFINENLYYKMRDIVDRRLDIDAKSRLQEYVQEKFKLTPFYKIIKEEGPDHEKIFTVVAVIGEKEYAEGKGKSKQLAEQDSAEKTLEMLKI